MWEEKSSIMITLENISEQVLNDRLKEIDKYKDNLLASVTHDLKTPLNCMMSFCKSALDSNNIVEIKKYIKIALKNGAL